MNAFIAYLSQLTILHPRVIILGDFNIDVAKTINFNKLLHTFDLRQHVLTPTCITSASSSLIDHIYTSTDEVSFSGAFNLNIANHIATYCGIGNVYQHSDDNKQHLVIQFRSFRSLNVAALLSDLRSHIMSLDDLYNVACTAANFIERFCNIWNQHAPIRARRV